MFSALPLRADIAQQTRHVRFVPEADIAMGLFDHLVGASKNARRDDRTLITKFVPDRRVAGGGPGLGRSIFCPPPRTPLHKNPPAGPRDAPPNPPHPLTLLRPPRAGP